MDNAHGIDMTLEEMQHLSALAAEAVGWQLVDGMYFDQVQPVTIGNNPVVAFGEKSSWLRKRKDIKPQQFNPLTNVSHLELIEARIGRDLVINTSKVSDTYVTRIWRELEDLLSEVLAPTSTLSRLTACIRVLNKEIEFPVLPGVKIRR